MGGHPSCTRLRSKHLYLLSFLKQNLGLFLTGFFFHLPSPQGHFYISWFLCPEDYCSLPTGLSVWTLPFELPLNYHWGPQPPGSLLGGVSKEGPNTEWPGYSLSFIAQPYLESLKQSLKRNPWRRMCWIQKRRPWGSCSQPGKQPSGQLTPLCIDGGQQWGTVSATKYLPTSSRQGAKDGELKDERKSRETRLPKTVQWDLPLSSELHALPAVPSFSFSILFSEKD